MPQFKKGDKVRFAGYSDESIDPILEKGQTVIIHGLNYRGEDFDSYTVYPEGGGDGDQVYEEEIAPLKEGGEEDQADEGLDELFKDDEPETLPGDEPETGSGEQVDDEIEDADFEGDEIRPKPQDPGPEPEPELRPVPLKAEDMLNPEDVSRLRADEMVETMKSLLARAEESYYQFGMVAVHAKRAKVHREFGYKGANGWAKFVEDTLGLKERKAQYFMNIYESFSNLGIGEAEVSQIGWSTAKEVARYIDEENKDKLLDYAKGHTRKEVEEYIKDEIITAEADEPSTPKDKVKKRRFMFAALQEEGDMIERGLERAKELVANGEDDEVSQSRALCYIVSEWMALEGGGNLDLGETMGIVGKRFGVKLKVDDGEAAPKKTVAKKATAKKGAKK